MTATPTENHAPPAHAPDATGRRSPSNDDPIVLLLYGEEHVNLALADELALDGYEVRRASDTAKLRAVCSEWEVELVIFGRAKPWVFSTMCSRLWSTSRRLSPASCWRSGPWCCLLDSLSRIVLSAARAREW